MYGKIRLNISGIDDEHAGSVSRRPGPTYGLSATRDCMILLLGSTSVEPCIRSDVLYKEAIYAVYMLLTQQYSFLEPPQTL